jgi:beta-1,4-mannosyl-glycoprotein beta-1,4-N-acetylglucosaminyltransferase
MAVYDVFPFFNELDLLEIRMEILDSYVDYFVIGECNKTFQGKDKPFYYLENKERYKKFEHKIIHNKFIDDKGNQWNNWDRDINHKNVIKKALTGCKDDDIILISDLDEIPNLEVVSIESFYKPDHLFHMMQKMYYYFDLQQIGDERNWFGTKVCSYSYFKNTNIDTIRNAKGEGIQILNGGWHFTFLGGVEKVIQKIESWGHKEFNNEYIKSKVAENIANGKDIFFRGNSNLVQVPIDNSYPKYLRENLDKYSHFVKGVYIYENNFLGS